MDRRRRVTANRKRLWLAARDLYECLSPAQQQAMKHIHLNGRIRYTTNPRTAECLREFGLVETHGSRDLTVEGWLVHAVANEVSDG